MKVFWCTISVLVLLLILVWSICYAASVLPQLTDKNIDTLKAAVSLGRLDVITMLLAVVAILLGGFGFFGFNYIVEKSERIAEKTAAEVARNRLEVLIPEIIEEYEPIKENFEGVTSEDTKYTSE
jgi:hypothetical protein